MHMHSAAHTRHQGDRTTRGIRTSAAVVAVLLAAGALAGCSGSGPMQMGDGTGEVHAWQCSPDTASPTGKIVDGDVFTLKGSSPIVIDDVALVDASNLVLDESYLIDLGDGKSGYLAFGSDSYPPTAVPVWSRREKAIGAMAKPGVSTNVVIVVHRPDRSVKGEAKQLAVTYTVDGRTYTQKNSQTFIVDDCSKQ